MLWPDLSEFQKFYTTPLGALVCRRIRSKIQEFWPETSGATSQNIVLGLGYATPYLSPMQQRPNDAQTIANPVFAVMPAKQGVTHWPRDGKNRAVFVAESLLPFLDSSVDRIIVIHALEFTDQPVEMLKELWRILKPSGKLLIIAPNRLSIWAQSEASPFGFGQPFTPFQLEKLLKETLFIPIKSDTELFMFPARARLMIRISEWFRRFAQHLLKPLGGVLVVEAEKQVYAPYQKPKKRIEPVFVPARGGV